MDFDFIMIQAGMKNIKHDRTFGILDTKVNKGTVLTQNYSNVITFMAKIPLNINKEGAIILNVDVAISDLLKNIAAPGDNSYAFWLMKWNYPNPTTENITRIFQA